MSKMFYLDFLQMVRPGREALDLPLFDFYLFGSFDALKVSAYPMEMDGSGKIFTLPELHRIEKERRQHLPGHFDRQPMYLYTEENGAEEIFRTDDRNAVRPLVLTLIQLWDPDLVRDTPAKLLEAFKKRIADCIDRENIPPVDFRVFFCLGEPDLVVAFRHDTLKDIGRLVYRIRLWDPEETEGVSDGICVFSTSSHCAFPGGVKGDDLRNRISSWTSKERDFHFLTLFDTAYGLDDNSVRRPEDGEKGLFHTGMLLGDRDYVKPWGGPDAPDLLADHILKPVTDFDADRPGAFRSSVSFPVIELTNEDLPYGPSDRKLSDLTEANLLSEYQGGNTAFSEMTEVILQFSDLYGGEERIRDLSSIVLSMQGTLNGILKHLYQLRDGRGQYDIYAFVRPAFASLPEITRNAADLLRKYREEYTKLTDEDKEKLRDTYTESVSSLLDTYIHDTSRLLTELQHLFSVLSISPHTYLESYGSNMRFVTAACKLLVAYQGIAYNLSSHYRMDLRKGGGTVQAEEVMLVIPYRRILQNTRVLFNGTGPEKRIVYIRINSSDMLRVRKTLFMLLHECGHHILNYDFREKRVSYFFKTFVGYLLEQAFEPVYREPLKNIQLLPYVSSDEITGNGSPGKIGHFDTDRELLRKRFINALYTKQNLSSQIEEFWNNKYIKQDSVRLFSEPVSRDNHFLTYVKKCACSFMNECLSKLETNILVGGNGDKKDFFETPLARSMTDILCGVFFYTFANIAKSEYENRLQKDDKDLWYLSELKTVYAMFSDKDRCDKDKVRRIIEWICRYYFMPNYSMLADEIQIAFSDIYSDVFAFSIMGFDRDRNSHEEMLAEAEVYIGILEEEAGFQINREFSYTYLIVRILALLDAFFGLTEEEIIVLFEKRLLMKKDAGNLVREQLEGVGYRFLKDYTEQLCIPQIRSQIGNNAALQQDMVQLKKMYSGSEDGKNAEEFMNAVYYFWKSSTQRKDRM